MPSAPRSRPNALFSAGMQTLGGGGCSPARPNNCASDWPNSNARPTAASSTRACARSGPRHRSSGDRAHHRRRGRRAAGERRERRPRGEHPPCSPRARPSARNSPRTGGFGPLHAGRGARRPARRVRAGADVARLRRRCRGARLASEAERRQAEDERNLTQQAILRLMNGWATSPMATSPVRATVTGTSPARSPTR